MTCDLNEGKRTTEFPGPCFQSDSFVQIQKLETRKIEKKNYKIFKKNLCPDPVSGPVRSGQPDRESRSGPVRSGFENPDPVGS